MKRALCPKPSCTRQICSSAAVGRGDRAPVNCVDPPRSQPSAQHDLSMSGLFRGEAKANSPLLTLCLIECGDEVRKPLYDHECALTLWPLLHHTHVLVGYCCDSNAPPRGGLYLKPIPDTGSFRLHVDVNYDTVGKVLVASLGIVLSV